MQPSKRELAVAWRILSFAIYFALLYGLLVWLTGRRLPTNGEEDLWLVGAVGFLAYALFDTPYFVPPSQVLATAVPSALLLLSLDLRQVNLLAGPLNAMRWASFTLAVLTIAAAWLSIVLRDTSAAESPKRAVLQRLANRFAVRFGDGAVMFTPPALISIVGFHQTRPDQLLWMTTVWIALVAIRPIELILELVRDVLQLPLLRSDLRRTGDVQRVDSPNIVRVRLTPAHQWRRRNVHVGCLSDGTHVHILPLFVQTQENELIGTGLMAPEIAPPRRMKLAPGAVYSSDAPTDVAELLSCLAGSGGCELVGFVVEDSKIGAIHFEIASEVGLSAGQVVFCRQGQERVFYQILDAHTKEESFEKNPRGTHIVVAAQLGKHRAFGGFTHYDWLPDMNTPVFAPDLGSLESTTATSDGYFDLGKVPHFGATVRARFRDLAEYHTAVLGVTGTGKTELVFDIVRQGIREGAKIFAVDFTGEYSVRLADLGPQSLGFKDEEMATLQTLVSAIETGAFSAADEKKALEKWEKKVRPTVAAAVAQFLEEKQAAVGLFELPDIANTRATLRATELYLSAIFDWARKNRKRRSILVVLEEAHTVIPEIGLFTKDRGETQTVVGRMSQIALQGRKYGVGLLLVSQRTALVSKTLLSQCNTLIAFALHDKTSLEYVESVLDADHVRALPRLAPRRAIAYGKGIASETPVLIEIPHDPKKQTASEQLNFVDAPRPDAPPAEPAAEPGTSD